MAIVTFYINQKLQPHHYPLMQINVHHDMVSNISLFFASITNNIFLLFSGDCSQVSSEASTISFGQAAYLVGKLFLLLLTYTTHEWQ